MRYLVKKLDNKNYEVKYVDNRFTPKGEEVEVIILTKEINKEQLLKAISATEEEQKIYNENTKTYLETTKKLLEEIKKVED